MQVQAQGYITLEEVAAVASCLFTVPKPETPHLMNPLACTSHEWLRDTVAARHSAIST